MKKFAAVLCGVLSAAALGSWVIGPLPGPYNSAGPIGDPDNAVFTVTYTGPSFQPDSMDFVGDLTKVLSGTYASEARWRITNLNTGQFGDYQPTTITSFTGTINVVGARWMVRNIFSSGFNTGDVLQFEAFESYNDGPGPDSYWTNVTFTFNPMLPAIYTFDMSTDPGWTMDPPANPNNPGWAFGIPQGTNDPRDRQCYGYNHTTVNNGNYPNNMAATEWLTTTPLDFTGYTGVTLEFLRYLGVESASYDHAYIEISNDGGLTWNTVWSHTGGTINDTGWTLVSYDISTWADNQPNVMVRWGMGPTDSSVNYRGWNIDDVVFRGIPEPASLLLLTVAALGLRRR